MHHVAPLRNSPTIDERRRHLRHKPTSIIYVALGPGNGGIVVNLSAGGVSLQAAAKLNAETELALNFRLQGVEQAIETVGYVTWLDPTHKEVGVSFKDLPGSTAQQIAEWIASQESPQTQRDPHPIPAARGEQQRLPIQASIPVIFPSEKSENAQPGLVPGILRESFSESQLPQHNDFGSTLGGMPPPEPGRSTLRFRNRAEEGFEGSPDRPRPFELSANHYELRLGPQSLPAAAREMLPRDCLLPDSMSPRPEILAMDRRGQAMPDSSPSDLRRRRKLAVAVAVGTMGILVLIVIATSLSRPPARDSSSAQTIQPIPASAAVLPEKAPQTGSTVKTRRTVRTAPSRTASTGVDAATSVPVVRVAIVPQRQDSGFIGSLRSLLGLDVDNAIDPAAAALPVWTVQHSGFYYCARSPDFRTLEPGAIMTQGQALQSGYQPKLGSYCE